MYQPGALRRRPFLGVHISRPSRGAPTREGATLQIAAVIKGGAAERAGLEQGDELVALNGTTLRDARHLVDFTRSLGPMPRVVFEFRRGEQRLEREAIAPPLPVEPLRGSIELGFVAPHGHRLRTITALPELGGPHPAVLYLQGVRADSCESPLDEGLPTARLVAGWTAAGFVVQRVERSGVGDSEGPAPERTDLGDELDGYDAALEALLVRRDVDPSRVFLFGQSFGGMIAPLLAAPRPLAGVVVFGTSAERWLDCVVATTERSRRLDDEGAESSARQQALWVELHELVCRQGWTPALAFQRRPHLRVLRSRDCVGETLYGRHVSLFQQLDGIDLKAAWRAVGEARCPVLALHGEHDWICSAEDARQIAECAGPHATHVELALIGHDLLVDAGIGPGSIEPGSERWDGSVVRATVDWMQTVSGQTFTPSQWPGKTHP